MRELHRREPGHWTAQVLSEAFPADLEVVRKVLKVRVTNPSQDLLKFIQEYDAKVEENWKLLSEGKLELPPRLESHLKQHFGEDFKERRREVLELSSGMEKELLEKRLKEHQEMFKPLVSGGKFGNIISDYNAKVAAMKALESGGSGSGDKAEEEEKRLQIDENGQPLQNVAEFDPEIAAKRPQAPSDAIASPPLSQPRQA